MKRYFLAFAALSVFATNFVASAETAEEARKREKDAAAAKIIEEVLTKLGDIRNLKFDINIDTSLGKLPLNDSSLSGSFVLSDAILMDAPGSAASTNKAAAKPRISIGKKSQSIDLKFKADRTDANVAVTGDVSFSAPAALPVAVGVTATVSGASKFQAKLKANIKSLKITADVDAAKFDADSATEDGAPKVAFGPDIHIDCVADLRTSSIFKEGQEVEKWEAIEICQFDGKFNPETKKYDVTIRVKN